MKKPTELKPNQINLEFEDELDNRHFNHIGCQVCQQYVGFVRQINLAYLYIGAAQVSCDRSRRRGGVPQIGDIVNGNLYK